MPGTSLKTGYINLQKMCADVVTDLKSFGFTLTHAFGCDALGVITYSGNTAPAHSDATAYYVLAPTNVVDPLAVESGADTDPNYAVRQPWRLVISAVDILAGTKNINNIRVWVVPLTQLLIEPSGLVHIASYAENKDCGYLAQDNVTAYATSENYFFSRNRSDEDVRKWSCYGKGEDNLADASAIPFSYLLSVTDHGVAFSMWAENYDKAGDCFNWFTVQRFIKDDGSILIDEKSPLICVFSQNGGGRPDSGQIDVNGILYFTVCEDDIHAPTPPVSAVSPSADSVPFINSIQQVSHMVNRNFVMHFPRGINTQRYYYPYKLDMVGYTSADVLSHKSLQTLNVNSEQRQFRSINANSANNTGMRPLFVVKGSGIV